MSDDLYAACAQRFYQLRIGKIQTVYNDPAQIELNYFCYKMIIECRKSGKTAADVLAENAEMRRHEQSRYDLAKLARLEEKYPGPAF